METELEPPLIGKNISYSHSGQIKLNCHGAGPKTQYTKNVLFELATSFAVKDPAVAITASIKRLGMET